MYNSWEVQCFCSIEQHILLVRSGFKPCMSRCCYSAREAVSLFRVLGLDSGAWFAFFVMFTYKIAVASEPRYRSLVIQASCPISCVLPRCLLFATFLLPALPFRMDSLTRLCDLPSVWHCASDL